MSSTATYEETTSRFGVLHLDVEVRPHGVALRLRPLERSFRHIPLAQVAEAATATYSPADYSGWHWGVRSAPGGNLVYRLRGNHGVELRLTGGRKVFIGSRKPDQLVAGITAAATRH